MEKEAKILVAFMRYRPSICKKNMSNKKPWSVLEKKNQEHGDDFFVKSFQIQRHINRNSYGFKD